MAAGGRPVQGQYVVRREHLAPVVTTEVLPNQAPPVQGPALPVFAPGAAGTVAPTQPAQGSTPVPAVPAATQPVAGPPVRGQGLESAARFVWRHRWVETPLVAGGALTAGAIGNPGATGAVAVVAATALAAWSQREGRVGGRMWLSAAERGVAAKWCGGALLVSAAAGLGAGPGLVAVGAAAVTFPTGWMWVKSRRVRPVGPAEDVADVDVHGGYGEAIIAAWPSTLGAPDGPAESLRGSRIDEATMADEHGVITFEVELGEAHAADAATKSTMRTIERAMRLPIGSVEIRPNRTDSGRAQVVVSYARRLEFEAAPWPGPALDLKTGSFLLAQDSTGKLIPAYIWNSDGVEHALISGSSGGGKSVTTTAVLLPGPLARREIVVYVDGGGGTSNGALLGACDWVATEEAEQIEAIRAVWRILKARKTSRSRLALSRWRGQKERYPVITLTLEEATTLLHAIGGAKSASGKPKATLVDDVMEILREGRKLGVRVIQITQDPMGSDCWGGRTGRGLIAGNGMIVAHRPNDNTSARLTSNGKSATPEFDLMSLPPVGGFAGIIRRGQVITPRCRILYVTEDAAYQAIAEHIPDGPRTLEGQDLAAAGPAYLDRTQGHVLAAQIAAARAAEEAGTLIEEPVEFIDLTKHDTQPGQQVEVASGLNSTAQAAADAAEANRGQILTHLVDSPKTRAQLVEATGLSRATVGRALAHLAGTGAITSTDGAWTITTTKTTTGATQ
jgi:CRP-like cAMP-binding protein